MTCTKAFRHGEDNGERQVLDNVLQLLDRSLSVLCLDQTFNYIFIICIDICSFKINLLASMHFLFHMNFRIRLLGVPISFSKNVCTSISHPTCSSLHGSDIPAMRAWVCVSSSCIWVGLTGRREAMTIETVLKGNISFAASSWGACCQIDQLLGLYNHR